MGFDKIQPSFAAGELAPSLMGRVDLAKYQVGLKKARNMFIHAHGGASNRPGTKYVWTALGKSRLIRFQFSVVQAYALEFSHLKMRIIKNGGIVVYPTGHALEGQVVEVATTYAETELDLIKFVQNADVLFLCHPNHPAKKLSRYDHHDWRFEDMAFIPNISPPTGLSGSYTGTGSTPIKYQVSVVMDDEQESAPCGMISVNGDTAGAWEAGKVINLSWNAVAGAKRYRVYKNTNGYFGYIGTAESNSFTDDNINPDESDGVQTFDNPFNAVGKYPYTATFFQQRLVYGGTNERPNTWWASRSGYPENFGLSHPLKDDDRIEATIAAREVNDIRHMVPLGDMILFTSGAEWKVAAGSKNDALTPTSMRVKPQSYYGCSHLPPIVIGDTALFVPRSGAGIRDLTYTLERDGYTGSDLAILANHFFENHKIVDWAHQQSPYGIVWCVRDDGKLLGFTYKREHEVWAWHLHETDGYFESVVSLPGDDADEVYFVVRREVNGQEVRYIEQLAPRLADGQIENAYFVDCGKSYEGTPVDQVGGLEHLEGKKVAVVADGQMLAPKTVQGGSISLEVEASVIHAGLPYTAELETLPIEIESNTGSIQGKKKRISGVTLRFEHTVNAKVGCRRDDGTVKCDALKFRQNEAYGDPTALFTGDKAKLTPGGWQKNGSVVVRQDDPLPMTLLAIIPEVNYG